MESIVKAGLTLGLTSLAVNFIFGPDCSIKDILPDGDVPKASSIVSSNDFNYLVSGSVGVAAGLVAGGSYRAIKAQFGGVTGAVESIENLSE